MPAYPTLKSLRSITSFSKHLNNHNTTDSHAPTKTPVSANNSTETGTVKQNRLRKPTQAHRSSSNLLEASPTSQGTFTLRHHQSEHPLADFRRRLARKASTFSLRTRRRQAERDSGNTAKEEERLKELGLLGTGKGSLESAPRPAYAALEPGYKHNNEEKGVAPQESPVVVPPSTRSSSVTTVRRFDLAKALPAKELPPLPATTKSSDATSGFQNLIRESQGTYVVQEAAGGKTCVNKMASEQAQPPVPYTRLKEITENACEAALADVASYVHPDTEKWNTTIINSILGALVQETTQTPAAGSSMPAQPQFKYVVNSTIIQHAASSSSTPNDDAKKTTGRRGMHAASGAYWNNEKDGMWSFKYPGADSKGLDVVVGIIWVWVG